MLLKLGRGLFFLAITILYHSTATAAPQGERVVVETEVACKGKCKCGKNKVSEEVISEVRQAAIYKWVRLQDSNPLNEAYIKSKSTIANNLNDYILKGGLIAPPKKSGGYCSLRYAAFLDNRRLLDDINQVFGFKRDVVILPIQRTNKPERANQWNARYDSQFEELINNALAATNYNALSSMSMQEQTRYLLDIEDIALDYQTGDELAPLTLSTMLQGLKGADNALAHFLLMGVIDHGGPPRPDPMTGAFVARMVATFKVHDLRNGSVDSLGTIEAQGRGSNAEQSTLQALEILSAKLATETKAKLSLLN